MNIIVLVYFNVQKIRHQSVAVLSSLNKIVFISIFGDGEICGMCLVYKLLVHDYFVETNITDMVFDFGMTITQGPRFPFPSARPSPLSINGNK